MQEQEQKRKQGHPTLYRPEYCEKVIEMGKQGLSKAAMALAFNVNRDTIHAWEKAHPAFSDAIAQAVDYAQSWWEDQARKGIWDKKNFDGSLWAKIAASRFADYRKVTRLDLTSSDGSVSALSKEQIEDKIKEIHARAMGREQEIAPKLRKPADDGESPLY